MVNYKFILMMILCAGLVMAIDTNLYRNQNLMGNNLTNATKVNATQIWQGAYPVLDSRNASSLTLAQVVANIGNWSSDMASYASIIYVGSIGNWTLDKSGYYTSSQVNTVGNWSRDKSSLPNLSLSDVNTNMGNWSADKPSYASKTDLTGNITGAANNISANNATAVQKNSDASITMNWTRLANYPVACPANSYVTQIDDAITCTAAVGDNSSWNESGARTIFPTNSSALLYVNASGFIRNQTIGIVSDNSSWNESRANSLYPTNASALLYVNSSGFIRNQTTGIVSDNTTWNESGARNIFPTNASALLILCATFPTYCSLWATSGVAAATIMGFSTLIGAIVTGFYEDGLNGKFNTQKYRDLNLRGKVQLGWIIHIQLL
jgi:hypothetical protein